MILTYRIMYLTPEAFCSLSSILELSLVEALFYDLPDQEIRALARLEGMSKEILGIPEVRPKTRS